MDSPTDNSSDISTDTRVESPPYFDALQDPNDSFGRMLGSLQSLTAAYRLRVVNRLSNGVFASRRALSKQELDSLSALRAAVHDFDWQWMDTVSLPGICRGLSYPDGNLVVQAGGMIFRVYRGTLARKSSVLEELLSPENLATYDTFEGCPVFRMPHSETDAQYFLDAIFNPDSFDPFVTKRIRFDAITAIFRVNLDYQVPNLSRKALALLSSVYPTTLADFTSAGLSPSYCRDQIMPVIQFARTHSVDWILPLAFYREDEGLCADARASLVATTMDAFEEHFASRGGECAGGADCRNCRIEEGAVLHARLLRLRFMPRLNFVWPPQPGSKLCGSCLEDMQRWHVQQCESVWDSLPGLFDLPDWNTLNKTKHAALQEADEDDETY
ncbi:hypothetical protein DFH06DRAFT_1472870 [Mycena polygramma]|nr:hypothetical protein DFH06DRAFT_1472870 [Mycena polygramma]